jgi:hypothetical protein
MDLHLVHQLMELLFRNRRLLYAATAWNPALVAHRIPSMVRISEQEVSGGPGETGPHSYRLMNTIRDVAVFAWGIVASTQYKCGTPTGDARPDDEMDLDDSR